MSSPSGGRQRSKTFSNDDNGGEAVSMSMAKRENNQGDSKKTIGSVFIPIATGSGFRLNHYDKMRTEGRLHINIGVGLSKLGYDVYFYCLGWPEKRVSSHLWYTHSKSGKYDYAFMLFGRNAATYFLHQIQAKKYVFAFYDELRVPRSNGHSIVEYAKDNALSPAQVLLAKPFSRDNLDAFLPYETKYLPQLFPLADYSTKFLDYSYAPQDNELKIYSQFHIYQEIGLEATNLITKIVKIIKTLDFRPKLYLQTLDETKFNMLNAADVVFLDKYIAYDDMYKMMRQCDFGLVEFYSTRIWGAPYDFISLGKPLLSFSYGPQVATHSSLAGCRKYIFDYAKYDDKQLENYLKKMISNPYEAYSSFRDRIRESEFDVWKNFALEAFSV